MSWPRLRTKWVRRRSRSRVDRIWSRIDVGLGKEASPEQAGGLEGVDPVVLGLGPVDGLHVEGVAEDEGDVMLGTEVSEPVPVEDALRRHDQVVPEGLDGFEEAGPVAGKVLVKQDVAFGVQNAQIEGAGMKVDPAVMLMLARYRSAWFPSWVGCVFALYIVPTHFGVGPGGGLYQYHAIATDRACLGGVCIRFRGILLTCPQQNREPLYSSHSSLFPKPCPEKPNCATLNKSLASCVFHSATILSQGQLGRGDPMNTQNVPALERISSASTGFWKHVFPPIWTLGVGVGMLGLWFEWFGNPATTSLKLVGVALWAGTSILFRLGTRTLREVWLAGEELVVSLEGSKVRIPLTDVIGIEETRGQKLGFYPDRPRRWRTRPEIRFIPVHRSQIPFTDHPIVRLLRERKVELRGPAEAPQVTPGRRDG